MIYLILITFILAPAYVIKFKLFGLPTDVLMMWVVFVWVIFAITATLKKQCDTFCAAAQNMSHLILILCGLFFLSGVISTFTHGVDRAKLGQFIVLFLQPISLFFIGNYIWQKYPNTKSYLLTTSYYLLAAAGLYAVLQYFTLIGLPSSWWGNSDEPKRALSFFVHPNFYALWCAPLLAFLIPDVAENLKFKIFNLKTTAWVIGVVGLLLSLSRAGWLGLGIAALVYLIFAADKKIRKLALGAVISMVIIIVSVPNLRWRFVLPFYGEKSAVSRLSLWQTGIKGIKEDPAFGLGLTGFSTQWETLNTDPGLTDTHNFPHNIFLDFWVETGLLGLISFVALVAIYIYRGLKSKELIALSISLFLIAMIFQGLIDNPYFKNDLAMMFWLVLSLTI